MNEVQEILDSLDRQLASGKIVLETYTRLTAKWQARLAEIPAVPLASPLPSRAEKVACPECGAPLDDLSAKSGDTVRCGFCRATFTLQRAQDQSAVAGQELRRWLDQLVVESVGTGTVDAASRRFIFAEKLYPALQREYRRGLEQYEDVQEHPVTYVDLLAPLPGYRLSDHVLLRAPESLPRVRALSAKLKSGLLADFAVADDDRQKLRNMDLGTANLVHLSNVAQLLTQPSPEAFASARDNLVALKQLLTQSGAIAASPGSANYQAILRARLDAGIQVLEVLSRVFSPDADFAAQVFLEELEAAEALIVEARQRAESSSYNPLALVPVRMGLEREAQILVLLQALLNAYRTFSRSKPLTFLTFYRDLKGMLAIATPQPEDIDQLITLINQSRAILQARRGMQVLHVLNQWSWVERQVEAGRKQGLFGPSETLGWQHEYWHPFWCVVFRYSLAKGTFLVSGSEQVGYGLVDAAARLPTPIIISSDNALHASLGQGLHQFGDAAGRTALLPSSTPTIAKQTVVTGLQQANQWRNMQLAAVELVYVPAALVQYQAKSTGRVVLYTLAGVIEATTANQVRDTTPLLERYA